MFQYPGKTALITGASSGIGEAFARKLAEKGMNLVLVARSEDKLGAIAAQIRQKHQVAVEIIPADLSEPDAGRVVFEATQTKRLTIDLLINNAGFANYGTLETTAPDKDRDQIMVNVAAVVDLTHRFLPAMQERKFGAVINVASTVAFFPLACQSVYGASKAFVLSFSEALWAENERTGVHVMALCPGATKTDFFDAMGKQITGAKQSPEFVVDAALLGLDARRSYVIPGVRNYVETALLPRLLPRTAIVRILARISRAQFAISPSPV